MQDLINLIQRSGFEVSEDQIRQWLQDNGKDPANLTKGEIVKMHRLYVEQNSTAIAPAASNKPASTSGKGLSRKSQDINPQESTRNARRRSLAQVEAMLQGLEETISDDNTAIAQHMLSVIDGNTRAADILQKFAVEAQGQEDNLEFFRDLGSAVGREFAIARVSDQAEPVS